MKSILWIITALVVVSILLVCIAMAQDTTKKETATHKYVGANKCKMCHNAPVKGDQFKKWSESKHAKAYKTLATEAGKKRAEVKKVADPQKDSRCLKCHTTGYGKDKKASLTMEEGVSCEACHGPGDDYKTMAVMKDKAKAKESGLIEPTEELCKTCHDAENSPNFKYTDYKAKIIHPVPK